MKIAKKIQVFILLFNLTILYSQKISDIDKYITIIDKKTYMYKLSNEWLKLNEEELTRYKDIEKKNSLNKGLVYKELDDLFLNKINSSNNEGNEAIVLKVLQYNTSNNEFNTFKNKTINQVKIKNSLGPNFEFIDLLIDEKNQNIDLIFKDKTSNMITSTSRFFSNNQIVHFIYVGNGNDIDKWFSSYLFYKSLLITTFKFK
jgi:hypothetical protein